MELIAVVMGADTSQERFSACKSMLDHGFATYALITPQLEQGSQVPVILGKQDTVQAVPAETGALLIEKGQKNQVNFRVELEESIAAPVSQGQRLGTLTVRVGEQILAQIPLIAAQPVEKLSFGDIFLRVLRAMTGAGNA